MTSARPMAACGEQIATKIDLGGAGLSPLPTRTVEGKLMTDLPTIRLLAVQDLTGAPASAVVVVPDDPKQPAQSDVTWSDQQHMSFLVCPQGVCSSATPPHTDYDLAPGFYSLSVTNRNGSDATLPNALTVVPRPTLTAISPDLLCQDQVSTLTLTGDFFVQVDGSPGTVGIGDKLTLTPKLGDCRTLPSSSGIKLEACKTATVIVPPKAVVTGKYAVVLTNPAPVGCHSTESRILTFVPEPTVAAIEPDLECLDEADQSMVVTGTGFLSFAGMLPTVVVDATHSFPATKLDGCTPVDGPKEAVLSCTSLTFILPKTAVAPGGYDVKVKNPAPADCISTTSARLTIVPSPVLATAVPDLACDAQGAVTFTLAGTGFLEVGTVLPTVKIGPFSTMAASATGCTALAGPKETVKVCTGLTVSVPKGTLAPGSYAVVVSNPETAECSSKQMVGIVIVPPPTLASIDPPALCTTAQANTITLTGTGFLGIGALLPTVSIGGVPFPATGLSGCVPVTGVAETVQSCTKLTVSLPKGALAMSGALPVVVQNPLPAGCSSTESVTFTNLPPPTVTGASPVQICRGGGDVDVTGTNFVAGMSTSLGGLGATTTTVSSSMSAKATFGSGLTPNAPARYPLTVTVPGACSATLPDAVSVVGGPILYFVDPPVVFNGITTVVTLYGSGLTKPITDVRLVPSGGGAAIDLKAPSDPGADRPQVAVPKGTAAGTYDVVLYDSGPCPGGAVLPKGLKIVDDTNLLALTSMTPAFGGTGQNTPATIKGAGLVATPRAYLSPSSGSGAATGLRATAFLDASTLTTVVKAGLPVAGYDLIVVNPDEKVGVLKNAFEVTAAPPPVVEDVSPGSVPKTGTPTVTIVGENFAAPGATVTLACVDASGVAVGAPVAAPGASTSSCPSATATCIGVSVPVGSLGTAQACVVRVTNPDGAFGEFSSLTLANPSANLGALQAGTDLVVARRALGAVAARGNAATRFLYAIGGDGGSASGALDSVEVATVDLFGRLGPWTVLPLRLPAKTTYLSAVAHGRYIYVVGGHDGGKAVAAVYRARVLDSLAVPEIADADIDPGGGTGLGGGTWIYRVSAVMPPGDPENPGGETLASDPFAVSLPDLAEKLQVKITWKPFPGAGGYRVYRTRMADLPLGAEELIATISTGATVTTTDTGVAPTPGAKPLPLGSTTRWVAIASLGSARAAAGVTKLLDPTDTSKLYIYALGGLDGGGAALGSIEHLVVTLAGATQTAAAGWTPDGVALPVGRWQLAAYAATNQQSSSVPAGSAFIYGAGGVAADGTSMVTGVDAFDVTLPGGALGSHTAVKAMTGGGAAGYGSVIANNFLYVFGGASAAPSSSASSALICDGPGMGCGGPAPILENNSWNSLGGISLTPGRYLMGSTLESSFIYLVAGATTSPGSASTSTVFTIW